MKQNKLFCIHTHVHSHLADNVPGGKTNKLGLHMGIAFWASALTYKNNLYFTNNYSAYLPLPKYKTAEAENYVLSIFFANALLVK